MPYTADPTNTSQPTIDVKASTAAAEFRALKAYIQGLVFGTASAGPGTRQVALIGSQNAAGDPNFLAIGTGLAVNLSAAAAPLCLTYAAGTIGAGDTNFGESVGADVIGVVSALPANNLSYITKLLGGAWGSTLAPCQYGKTFDRTAQLLFRWPGANNAVATTEDFGNVLTFAGDAKISTAVQILGQNTLAGDGTGDGVRTPFTAVGADSWEFFGSFRLTSIAAISCLFTATNAGNYGVLLYVQITGKLNVYASSTGTTYDIVNAGVGLTTIAINTTYFYRFCFDATTNTYRVFLSANGAAEVLEYSIVSAFRICALTTYNIGIDTGANSFIGNLGYAGFRKYSSANTAAAVGPTVAPDFTAVRADYFSIPQMKMYQVTAVSTVSGTDPTMTAVSKLYLGEAVTGAAAVTSVVNYAYKGKYESAFISPLNPGASGLTQSHNIGVVPLVKSLTIRNITSDNGYVPGDVIVPFTQTAGGYVPFTPSVTSKQIQVGLGNANGFVAVTKAAGALLIITSSAWSYKLEANRGW